jgi:hypothetical protein
MHCVQLKIVTHAWRVPSQITNKTYTDSMINKLGTSLVGCDDCHTCGIERMPTVAIKTTCGHEDITLSDGDIPLVSWRVLSL